MNRTLKMGVKKLQRAFSLKANRAETGIGTLIIFIAMVLVAAVAATVLIHTAGNLQQKATSTGSQTTTQVSTGLSVQSVWGLDNATVIESGNISEIAIYVTPNAGSSGINLNQTTVQITYDGVTASLTYAYTPHIKVIGNATAGYHNKTYYGFNAVTSGTSDVFNSTYFAAANGTHFAVLDLKDPQNSMTKNYPVVTSGGEAAILINVQAVFGSGISQNSQVSGSVNPQVGNPGVIQFDAPFAFTQKVMQLQ